MAGAATVGTVTLVLATPLLMHLPRRTGRAEHLWLIRHDIKEAM